MERRIEREGEREREEGHKENEGREEVEREERKGTVGAGGREKRARGGQKRERRRRESKLLTVYNIAQHVTDVRVRSLVYNGVASLVPRLQCMRAWE